MLKYVRSQNPSCPWDENVCKHATQNFNLNILQLVHAQDHPCSWDDTSNTFPYTIKPNIEILIQARSQDPPFDWDDDMCRDALIPSIDTVKWLLSLDLPESCLTQCQNILVENNNRRFHKIRRGGLIPRWQDQNE